jgi:hypothetical protein
MTLYCASAAFVIYGVLFLISPVFMTSLVGIQLPTSSARIDVRATYGGFVIGTGALFALCGLREEWERVGLLAVLVTLGGSSSAEQRGSSSMDRRTG